MIKVKLWQHKEENKMEKAIKKRGKIGIRALGKMLLGVAIGVICTNMAGIETYAAWDTREGVTALSNLGSGGSDKVWFGSGSDGNGSPIYWRVLDTTANDGSTKALFMLTEYSQGTHVWDSRTSGTTNVWEYSNSMKPYLQTDSNGFYNTKFTAREQNAMVSITKSESGTPSWNSYASPCGLSSEKIFLLSGLEVGNSTYGLTSSSSRICRTSSSDSTEVWWWLRSAYSENTSYVARVLTNGSGGSSYSGNDEAVRCALNINLSSVIFTSPASNASGTSNLTLIPASTDEARKLILRNSGTNTFSASTDKAVYRSGEDITITYSGATTNNYISVLLYDTNKSDVYYGTSTAVGTVSDSGITSVTVSNIPEGGTYILKVLDEEKNAANVTNYAWESEDIEIEIRPSTISNIRGYHDSTWDRVYFGSGSDGNGDPILWRVLDTTANDGSTKALFMLTEYSQGNHVWDSRSSNSNVWANSNSMKPYLQTYSNGFYNTKFTAREQNAMVSITKSESGTPSWYSYASPCGLSSEKIFLLSGLEVGNSTYGLSSNSARICRTSSSDSTAVLWWLRSARSSYSNYVALVDTDGSGSCTDSNTTYGAVRCALNINLTSVIFTSPASNASGTSNLTLIPSSTSEARKLTLKDSSKNSFTAYPSSVSQKAGNNITIAYSGATTSSKDYISVLIFNSNKTTVYYRTVKAVGTSSGSGVATITIPSGLSTGTYTLRVLDEEKNAANYTNYAWYSDITLTVTSTASVDSNATNITNVYKNGNGTYFKLTANDGDGLLAVTDSSGETLLKYIGSLGTSGSFNVATTSGTTTLRVYDMTGNYTTTPAAEADTTKPALDGIVTYNQGNYTVKVTDTQSGIWKITDSTGENILVDYSST